MSLSFEENKEAGEKTSKSAALLNKYLSTAVRLTNSDTIWEANKYLSDYATRPAWDEIDRKDIDAKRAEIKKELKNFGFRDVAAYYGNVKSGEHMRETMVKMGVVAAATIAATAVSPEVGQAVAGAGLAYMVAKAGMKVAGAPTTPKELFSTRDYVDLKHAQMALNKLAGHQDKKERDEMKRQAMINGVYYPMPSARGGMGY